MWRTGRIRKPPTPYYGFEEVAFVNGHGHGSWGKYVNWLDREHSDEAYLFHERVPLEPPSPAADFYTASYKWALPFALHPMTWTCDRTVAHLNRYGQQRRRLPDRLPVASRSCCGVRWRPPMCRWRQLHPTATATVPMTSRHPSDEKKSSTTFRLTYAAFMPGPQKAATSIHTVMSVRPTTTASSR